MEKEELKTMFDEYGKTIGDTIKTEAAAAAKTAVEEVLNALPEVKAARGVQVEVEVDEADRPFKSSVSSWAQLPTPPRTGALPLVFAG